MGNPALTDLTSAPAYWRRWDVGQPSNVRIVQCVVSDLRPLWSVLTSTPSETREGGRSGITDDNDHAS
jgi:hypothetical protein